MPLFVKIYLACISPYSISAACSIRSLWWLSSNSSSNENKKKISLNQEKVKSFKQNGYVQTQCISLFETKTNQEITVLSNVIGPLFARRQTDCCN